MANRHIIGKQTVDLQLAGPQRAFELQEHFSRLFWREISPALEQLFSRLAGEEELVRIDKLEVNLGTLTERELLSEAFVQSLVQEMEAAIAEELRRRSPQNVMIQPLRLGRFELWLHFLEHGWLPPYADVPLSGADWSKAVFDTLGLEQSAVERLSALVAGKPWVIERLILQYDSIFLQRIIELYTGHKQGRLSAIVRQWAAAITGLMRALVQSVRGSVLKGHLPEKEALLESLYGLLMQLFPSLRADSAWRAAFKKWAEAHAGFLSAGSFAALQRQLEVDIWRIVLSEVLIRRRRERPSQLTARALGDKAMVHWLLLAGPSPVAEGKALEEVLSRFAQAVQKIPGIKRLLKQRTAAGDGSTEEPVADPFREDKAAPPAAEGDEFFIPNAGLILLHPFLPRFFQKQGLLQDAKSFKDERSRQKAIILLHFLSSGEVQTPEYQLVLPKFLCGMPLNMPVDHSIEISPAEQEEGEHLLQAAIEHWGALGSTSPEGLREGFLQREGKLSKTQTGWLLQVERQTIDVLLDKLPWNLSMIKLPWMEELLKVDWR